MHLRDLRLKKWDRLSGLRIPNLATINLITGRHGSGKSALLGAIEALTRFGKTTIPEHGPATLRYASSMLLEADLAYDEKHPTVPKPQRIEPREWKRQREAVTSRLEAAGDSRLVVDPTDNSMRRETAPAWWRALRRKQDQKDGTQHPATAGDYLVEMTNRIAETAEPETGLRMHDLRKWTREAGSGQLTIAETLIACRRAAGGVVIVDLMDGHVHPDRLRAWWAALIETANEEHAQLFWATHSRDSVVAAAAEAESAGTDCALHQLETPNDGKPVCLSYNTSSLKTAIGLGMPLV